MKSTAVMRLQLPDGTDVYNKATIEDNYREIDKLMGNIGGETKSRIIDGAAFLSDVIVLDTDNFTLLDGALAIMGDGTAALRIWVTNKKELNVSTLGIVDRGVGAADIAQIRSAYRTAITQPLTSYTHGPAFGGFISTTNITFRICDGYFSTGKLPVGTNISLAGTYPLANIPKGIGLENMPERSFSNDTHIRNLNKIDAVAKKLEALNVYDSWGLSAMSDVFVPASGITVDNFALQHHRNGCIELSLGGSVAGGIQATVNGDITNLLLGNLKPGYRPRGMTVGARTTDTRIIVHGQVGLDGDVYISSTIGRSVANSTFRITASWGRYGG